MKILKIFGIVAGIHLFALILIFANPGCSSTTKPKPAVADTAPKSDESPKIVVPSSAATVQATGVEAPASGPVPVAFNPDAPAATVTESGVRFVPTRPGTPVAGALVTEPVAGVTPASTYTVKSGDSLWTIAKKNNLTVAELSAANGLATTATLRLGQKLIIPGKSPTAATAPAAAAPAKAPAAAAAAATRSSDGLRHTVKAGETLGVIARNYGVRQGDIAVANNISDPAKIRAGMELIIPGVKTGGTKAAAPAKAAEEKAPTITIQGDAGASPAPAVPVIRVDDAPVAPAPKP
jgi:LysM repeat protein